MVMPTPDPWFRPGPDTPTPWLANLTPADFMRHYWQKKPLLVRGAFPADFAPITIAEILSLCAADTVESRLVRTMPARKKSASGSTPRAAKATQWTLDHGPFAPRQLPALPSPNWTVLVQQVNTCLPAADRFLDAFRFVPEARLDDLMVSVAGPGGGIGAHVDSYDVFLVQASGQRRWEIAQSFAPDLHQDVPLKILKRFTAENNWVLNPGDLLYLPPQVAHRGTAVGSHCMTWSVGFRAPNRLSLADAVWSRHLDGLADADWQDPWLSATDRPGEIPSRLLSALTRQVLADLPRRADIRHAIGVVLSEPAAQAVFTPPAPCHSRQQFAKRARQTGLRLASATRLLFAGNDVYINGEALAPPPSGAIRGLQMLANTRTLSPKNCVDDGLDVLYAMYRSGWIVYH